MLKITRCRSAAFLATTLFWINAGAQVPVIPGIAGYGTTTPAGRGGQIIKVTNLNNSGTGSLRACVAASGPRICVFEISGTIWLDSDLTVHNPNLTIAGQTAPNPGILLAGNPLTVGASDVLVQHLAIRVGDNPEGTAPNVRDTFKIEVNNPISNVVIDHCSIAWSIDENVSFYKDWNNVTFSNSIVSEALHDSLHPMGPQSNAVLAYSNNQDSRVSFTGNLFAHNKGRNPRTTAGEFVFVNNVVYNPGTSMIMLFNANGITSANSIVSNVFVDGPNTKAPSPVRLEGLTEFGQNQLREGTSLFLSDNVGERVPDDQWSMVNNQSELSRSQIEASSTPAWPNGLVAKQTRNSAVLNYVLENAGSRPGSRNGVDSRIVADVRNGTGRIINCVSDDGSARCAKNAGGWPVLAENIRRLSVPANPHADDDGDGYTNVEEWLHAMAADVEGRANSGGSAGNRVRPLPPTMTK